MGGPITVRSAKPALVTSVSRYHPSKAAHLGRHHTRSRAGAAKHRGIALYAAPDAAVIWSHGMGFRGKSTILTVGRLSASERYKGHDRIIAAMPRVLARVPHAAYLIVGSGDDRPRLEQIAVDCAVDEHVVFAGHVPETRASRLFRAGRRVCHAEQRRGFRNRLSRSSGLRAFLSSPATQTAASMRWLTERSAGLSTRTQTTRLPPHSSMRYRAVCQSPPLKRSVCLRKTSPAHVDELVRNLL